MKTTGSRTWTRALAACAVLVLAACASTATSIESRGTAGLDAAQVAVLEIPGALALLQVDGQAIDARPVADPYRLRLSPGSHRLRLAYEETWGHGNVAEVYYSDHVVEVRLDALAGRVYRVVYDAPENTDQLSQLVGDLQLRIEDPATGAVFRSRQVALYGTPLARGFRSRFGGGSAELTDPADTADPVAAQPPLAPVAASAGAAPEVVLPETDALERLQFWWKLASAEERRAFRSWIDGR